MGKRAGWWQPLEGSCHFGCLKSPVRCLRVLGARVPAESVQRVDPLRHTQRQCETRAGGGERLFIIQVPVCRVSACSQHFAVKYE